jgi:hypothetical protein
VHQAIARRLVAGDEAPRALDHLIEEIRLPVIDQGGVDGLEVSAADRPDLRPPACRTDRASARHRRRRESPQLIEVGGQPSRHAADAFARQFADRRVRSQEVHVQGIGASQWIERRPRDLDDLVDHRRIGAECGRRAAGGAQHADPRERPCRDMCVVVSALSPRVSIQFLPSSRAETTMQRPGAGWRGR